MKTFKILGLLLTYPNKETISHYDELRTTLEAEKLLSDKQIKAISVFIDRHKHSDLLDLQEEYVSLFDRSRSYCLQLFEHVHGESRDRGQAMVDLAEMYAEKNLEINKAELPDYLPLFLEYLSLCTFAEAKDLLDDMVHIVATIGAKLKKNGSDYHIIFDSIEALADIKVDSKIIDAALADLEKEDNSLEALDKEWEEAEAFDGKNPQDDCNSCDAFPKATEALKKIAGV